MSKVKGLVLSRRVDESISIVTASGERIVVHVGKIKGNKVSLVTDADPSVKILRTELVEKPEVADAP